MNSADLSSIRVRLFGAFRKYETDSGGRTLAVPHGTTVARFRELLCQDLTAQFPRFADTQLIMDSAIADEEALLSEDDLISEKPMLALLPPVCGG